MKLSDKDFELLRDFIYNHCGMYFHASKKYFLESRIARRLEATKCSDIHGYMGHLKVGMGKTEELTKLLNEITTNETCFFRNPPQLKALENVFLPEIVATKGKIGFRKIRIWSAGSSSGEEAYTMAMMMLEKRSTILKDWIIEIVGTDISESVLAQAREGIYNAYSVRNTPDFYLKKYFREETGGRFLLSPDVKKLVSFSHLNLYEDSKMVFMKSFDFIFCANVLIYFDLASKTKVVQHFYNNLQPYGYFFVGQSESLHGVNDKFKTVHFPGGFAYKK
ncbi:MULTISPECIES: CheR family methyltransferase [Geobacter]|uniref:protein-glutamate O-methyltransferase n=2 Tax=Geobacter TaxID=28231 RepID=A0A0C1R0I1_9BACT|nr:MULTISPECIES: protein-glutamate O-methyltransferase CheR [Geobacter]ANA39247.1 chemotaxis protein CheR [Geobacter anodireducens]KIE43976.1 chemotaxis protein CheR [Geobacter soli]MBE2886569.1 protein-glutamate O-methyltransferase CheR [Geobacter anodireducens]HMN02410.1 protein-glutamate O-methyltransferase CheR [Geobacter anodireducens]